MLRSKKPILIFTSIIMMTMMTTMNKQTAQTFLDHAVYSNQGQGGILTFHFQFFSHPQISPIAAIDHSQFV